MVFYYLAWPVSRQMRTYYEDWGDASYVAIVALSNTSIVYWMLIVVYNAVRIYRAWRANDRRVDPPRRIPPVAPSI